MEVHTIVNDPISSNCFVVYTSSHNNCIVIDPGTEQNNTLISFLSQKKIIPQFIFLTHEHFDHIWGVNTLREKYTTTVICSKHCSDAIVHNKKNMSLFYNQIGFELLPADKTIEDLDFQLEWNNRTIECIITKGHTKGSMCLYIENMLFTGDTLIKDHKTVTKLPGGNKTELTESIHAIKNKFEPLNPKVYPGHGESFFLQDIDLFTAL